MKSIYLFFLFFVVAIHSFIFSTTSDPCVFVIFGATGDLTGRKLLPALYHLAYEGHISQDTVIVGFARGKNTHESFRNKMGDMIDQFSRTKPKDASFWNTFKNHIFYHQSNFESDEGYQRLQQFLAHLDQEWDTRGNRIYYLATQPSYFPSIIAKLKAHQLIYEADGQNEPWSRVMIEKPFGYDLNSAMQLHQQISQCLDEKQIYRIDHYLGKEGIQNLMALRFKNALFEPIWNHQYIDNIQITMAEEIGIGSRARLWEETGTLRDVVQNHFMQILAMIAMEPPADFSAASMHKNKIQVLETIRPFPLLGIHHYVVRGQYGSGMIQEKKVLGYREEKEVSSHSMAETFIAMKLFIDNERWKDVPFYMRSGKRLAKQVTEIAITFRHNHLSSHQNVLFIRIQPNPGIFLKAFFKVPGFSNHAHSVILGCQPNTVVPEAYERIIFDCIQGNDNLFVKAEEQIAAWRLLNPILDHWQTQFPEDFPNYESGTWGPQAADQLLLNQGHCWQLLEN